MFYAGMIPTADELNEIGGKINVITTSVPVASTTPVELSQFATDLTPSAGYLVELALQVVGASVATDDVAISWSVPGGTSVNRHALGPTTGMTDSTNTAMKVSAHNPGDSVPYGLPASGSSPVIREQAIVQVGATPGVLRINVAKVADTGNDISVQVRSWMRITRYA